MTRAYLQENFDTEMRYHSSFILRTKTFPIVTLPSRLGMRVISAAVSICRVISAAVSLCIYTYLPP